MRFPLVYCCGSPSIAARQPVRGSDLWLRESADQQQAGFGLGDGDWRVPGEVGEGGMGGV